MKKSLLMVFLFVLLMQAAAQHTGREKYNFNSQWLLKTEEVANGADPTLNDLQWKAVTLPYAWNEDEAFRERIDSLSTGIVWYRKHFRLPASAAGKKVFIEFEGIRQGGDLYLNGQLVGTHDNGVMAFGFDITDLIKPGAENIMAFRIDNAWNYHEKSTGSTFQWSDRNFNANYGGITKNVWLHLTDKVYQTLPLYSTLKTTGTYVYARDYNISGRSALVCIESQVRNEYPSDKKLTLDVEVKDAEGKTVSRMNSPAVIVGSGQLQTLKASATVKGLNFWSWGYGYLYTVHTRLKVDGEVKDELKTTTGFRKTAFGKGMIYLNDRVIMMHGFAQRTTNEWPAIGPSVPAWLSDYNNGMMVKGGGNLVRWMHITPWKQDIESCDRVGLIQAMPAGDAEKDVTGRRWEQRVELMRDAIIYNRNNPSILFYEAGNESISREHMLEMIAIRDQYDPFGGRATGSREMLNIDEAEYGGEMLYINKSAGKPLWAMEYARDEGFRKYWDEFTPPFHKNGQGPLYRGADASDYNKNQDAFALDAVKQWYDYWRERPGTGSRVSAGGTSIMFSESNTFTRSAFNYRTSGKVDAMRITKDAFDANRVMWNGWIDPDPGGIHIVGHWNYQPGTTKPVYVIAAGDKVTLFLNGKSLGSGKQQHRFAYVFDNISFQPGILKAVSYNAAGKKLSEAVLETAGTPVALRLKATQHPDGFMADGADLSLIEVEVVDARGRRCPTALDLVNFELTGPAEWRGGIAQGPDNYILAKTLPVQAGVNRVLIRSTSKAGKISLKATAAGLKPAILQLQSLPFEVTEGLGKRFPADGLKSSLAMGPTPATPSYTTVRQSVPVASAIAGANSGKAAASFDDNELSDWVNDGKANTAWITYTLEKPSTVSAVALKLNNFRSRSYPLVIKVDGQIVFEGASETTLGYYTQTFTPIKGRTVTIALGNKEAVQKGVDIGLEVTGKKLDDGVIRDDKTARGTLSIIEADIFR